MNNTILIIVVVVVVLILGLILGAIFSRRQRSKKFQNTFGAEYDRTVQSAGNAKKAPGRVKRTPEARRDHECSPAIHQ